jgi:hypothetical protein
MNVKVKRRVAEICEFLSDAGATDLRVEENKHVKIRWCYRNKQQLLVMGSSPSDWRAAKNAWRDVRNILRKADDENHRGAPTAAARASAA